MAKDPSICSCMQGLPVQVLVQRVPTSFQDPEPKPSSPPRLLFAAAWQSLPTRGRRSRPLVRLPLSTCPNRSGPAEVEGSWQFWPLLQPGCATFECGGLCREAPYIMSRSSEMPVSTAAILRKGHFGSRDRPPFTREAVGHLFLAWELEEALCLDAQDPDPCLDLTSATGVSRSMR